MSQNSLFKNSIYKAILTIVNILIPVFIGPYIARVLDINAYGIYNKAYAEFQVFLVFASFGVYNYGVREISKIRNNKEKISQLFSNLFIISLISNLLVLTLYIVYSFNVANGNPLYIYMAISLQIVGNIFYIEFVNEALENYKFITIKTFVVRLIYFISIFIFVKKPNDILIYSLIVGLTVIVNNLVSYIFIRKEIPLTLRKIEFKKYIKPLFFVLIINNISLLYSQLDKIMLGRYISSVSVTIYYIPYYIASMVASVPAAMISVSIPRLSYIIKNDGKEAYEKKINSIISPYLFLVIPICIGMLVLSKEIIIIYGSQKYMASIIPFAYMCIFRIIICCGSLMSNLVMYPNNKEKNYIRFALMCGIINLILNYFLIIFKIFSPTTAFITTGIAETILAICQYIYIKKKMGINLKIITKNNALYLLLSLLFIPIAHIIKLINFGFYINVIIIIAICMGLYFIVLYILKDNNLMYLLEKAHKILIKFKGVKKYE